ncbi:MAG TPA: sensor domain-containing protein [Rhodanobacteraceae bacterium]|nr:sensor domain-containing protein [Rhodanobacteraceae bacterium]
MNATPQTIAEYLEQLRAALAGADPAMIQDALYDAEEHLRSELADNPGVSEAELLAKISSSYGAPEEVAEIYRNQEATVTRALRPPPRREPSSNPVARFFAVAGDPHAYSAMFYLLLSLATGIFYFTWAVAGIAMSMAFALSLIGIPFLILFFGSVRMLSLLEGRIVEGMLGVRMPRRPPYTDRDLPLGRRIVAMFTDPRSWSSLFYMLVMLPLGIFYFVLLIVSTVIPVALMAAPFAQAFWGLPVAQIGDINYYVPPWILPIEFGLGFLGLFLMLHVARGIGRMHGSIAKNLLVKIAA